MAKLYDSDFYAWTVEQSKLLKQGNLELLDIENLVEEIESLGRQEFRELVNRLKVLIGHLLKWQFQPEKRTRSWEITIRNQRKEINQLISENPSLKPRLSEAMTKGFDLGLDLAVLETGLDDEDFPVTCPYSLEQLLDPNFLPDK